MITAAQVMFLGSASWVLYPYLEHRSVLWFLSTFESKQFAILSDYLPTVSVLIAAREGEQNIRGKVKETLGWDYPFERLEVLVASDDSEDQSDEILHSLADQQLFGYRYAAWQPITLSESAENPVGRRS